jgi:hypothetical protein
MSGLVALAAVSVSGIAGQAAAGTASAAVTPSFDRYLAPSRAAAAGGSGGYSISCGSAKSCLAVGTYINNSTGNPSPVARAWNGAKWKSVVIHAPKGTSFDGLSGVSCKSATYCLVMGDDTVNASGDSRAFAVIWNGSAVSAAPLPPVPAGVTDTALTGVSCVAVKSCVAAGVSETNGISVGTSGAPKVVVETWNGMRWSLHAYPVANSLMPSVTGLSCVSLTHCMISGETFPATGSGILQLLYSWNGKTLTAMKVPAPSGLKPLFVMGVSCTSTSSCAVVGDGTAGSNSVKLHGYAETWNGKVWTAAKLTWPKADQAEALEDVSCTYSKAAGTQCVAVGAAGTQNTASPVAVSWNGKAWSVRQLPGPGAGKASVFEGVSCLSAKQCAAIGETGTTTQPSGTPLAGFWNGSAWKLMAA